MEMTQEETEEIFETIMTENLPQSMSDTQPQIQETQREHKAGLNAKKTPYTEHTIFKLGKKKNQRQ